MKTIDYRYVNLTDGFWKQKQEMNRKITINAVWDRFYETGRVKAFECNWKEGEPDKPHIYWDSDVAKWMEAASYVLYRERDEELEGKVEWLINCIEKNRRDDGYFNIYFNVVEPSARFTRRTDHELYCAGHLFEAAVAYYEATGKDRFLKLMEDYADCIYRVFVEEKSAGFVTPGHEEIELALVRMYRATGNPRHLELAKFFLDNRGRNTKDTEYVDFALPAQSQSNAPVRELVRAEGHCVRALYLYSAMADYAKETGDEKMLCACKTLYNDIVEKKMYITGGVGSTYVGEAFTVPYDLPNDTAYTETCAAISLAFFTNRMLGCECNAMYAETCEKALFNGVLSGISLDGKGFFYENPLEINLAKFRRNVSTKTKDRFPITRRPEVFGCSCCPPNIARLLPSIGGYIYGMDEGTLYVNQFISSELECDGVKAKLSTKYPYDGHIEIQVDGVTTLMVRIPSWAKDFKVSVPYEVVNGYAKITDVKEPVKVDFEIVPRLVKSNPRVWDNMGKVALVYGPIVYCVEAVDNSAPVHTLIVDKNLDARLHEDKDLGVVSIDVKGYAEKCGESLYCDLDKAAGLSETRIRFIPYHAFANRDECDMAVWMRYI